MFNRIALTYVHTFLVVCEAEKIMKLFDLCIKLKRNERFIFRNSIF